MFKQVGRYFRQSRRRVATTGQSCPGLAGTALTEVRAYRFSE